MLFNSIAFFFFGFAHTKAMGKLFSKLLKAISMMLLLPGVNELLKLKKITFHLILTVQATLSGEGAWLQNIERIPLR